VINLDFRANPDRLKHTRAVVFHADLIDALAKSDPDRARAAVEQDIQGAADFIISQGHLPA
jgi:DNA-binding GntR family transcriptional regulator